MTRVLIAAAFGAWLGLTLMLSTTAWGRRLSLAERLRPHVPGGGAAQAADSSASGWQHAFGPLAASIGGHLAGWLGIREELGVRLRRVHDATDPTAFRLRQVGASAAALGVALAVALVAPLPPLIVAGLLVGSPLLAFVTIEQRLSTRSQRWQRRLFLEAPIIAEQLAMHLTSGASLSGALTRSAERGSGAIAADLRFVLLRIRQGLSEADALGEWAAVAQVPAISRLCAVLSLAGEASDLGRIVSDEARSLRREVHRELIATIESRNQQVWIPVTVSALIPGVIVLAIPFLAAIGNFAN
jgi:tight adherence protein C